MATVTKLKAAVNNINLPILGSDGNLYSYFVGRWQNAISDLGYTPIGAELTALETFIADGINNGWIDRVKYFMPFIGAESTPLTGMVPLIDNVANYELSVDSADTKLFRYDNGKIMGIGGRDDNAEIQVNIPVTTRDLGLSQCFSAYIDCLYGSNDISVGIGGTIVRANSLSVQDDSFIIRKGSTSSTSLFYLINGTSSSTTGSGTPTSEDVPQEIGTFWSVYVKDNSRYRVRGTLWKGESSLRNYGTDDFETQFTLTECQFKIGTNSRPLKLKVNTIGILDPFITSSELLSFNQAVFALTTALGRDVPTT